MDGRTLTDYEPSPPKMFVTPCPALRFVPINEEGARLGPSELSQVHRHGERPTRQLQARPGGEFVGRGAYRE